MDPPKTYVFSDEYNMFLAWGVPIMGFVILIVAIGIGLATTDVTITELILPCVALGSFWLVWIAFFVAVIGIHLFNDKRSVKRMFAKGILEQWQFRAQEWQAIVAVECALIRPEVGGIKAYAGAVYSSIVGIIFAAIMIAVSQFVIQDTQAKTAINICALAVLLLFFAVGFFQPVWARFKARRYRRKALRVTEPRVWFASEGVYHETFGYTSLNNLIKVSDHTKSRKSITFTLMESHDETSTHPIPYSFPVPAGYEKRAAELVRWYREERLRPIPNHLKGTQ